MHRHVSLSTLEDDHDDHPMHLRGRPLRKTIALAASVALTVGIALASGGDADAAAPKRGVDPAVAVGQMTFTSQAACPEGLKVEVVLYSDEQGWSLTALPAHLGCTMRAEAPMAFMGDWDPSGRVPCSFATGQGCFRRVDAPGLMKISAVPSATTLSLVEVEYRQGLARLVGSGVVYRVDQDPSIGTPVTLAGVAEVTAPGCTTRAYKVPFVAVSDGGGVWTLQRPAAAGVFCAAVVYGGPASLVGAWDPSAGGCLSSGVHRFCLGPMPDRGLTNGIVASWCPGPECWHGEAWVARI